MTNSERVTKFIKENYDEIKVRVPKGKREEYKDHAEAHGESLNAFIKRAIEHQMEEDNRK